ncbi:MAG: MarR family winged helix-turn-helix transcriptional regulator [Gemmatimonadota bacterium]
MSTAVDRRARLLEAFAQAGREVSAATVMLHATIAEILGMNPTDHKCVDILLSSGPLAAGQLADRTGLTTGAITGVIDRLERAGYVRREPDPSDRRRVIVVPILDTIQRDIAPLFEPLDRQWEELCSVYTDDELELIVDAIRRSARLLRERTAGLGTREET